MPHAAGLWYEWHGPEGGPVLILSPGLGGSGSYWAPNLAALSRKHRVLLYDHRGTGRSGSLPDGAVSIGSMAADVAALMDELGIRRPHFLGHAIGGLIGLELGERLAKRVVVNGWPRLDPHTERCFDVRLELLRSSGPEAYVRAQPIFLYPAGWSSMNSGMLDVEAEHQVERFPPVATVERRIAAARAFELRPGPPCPTLLVAAEDDVLVPALCSELLAGELANATVARLERGGHACNVTEPDAFNRLVLEFLGS
ncbi:MAG TPA: pyrimidine utilization protein D [Allosphingosinicella sp.]|jgi:aminoacrylate hydrolase|nr:pyrimidine utilization protein D [Allosphingosinicella sp.]